MSESAIYRRQILMSKGDSRSEKVEKSHLLNHNVVKINYGYALSDSYGLYGIGIGPIHSDYYKKTKVENK